MEPKKQQPSRETFQPVIRDSLNPDLSGWRQSEREAYQLILKCMEPGQMHEFNKMSFLRAVETLSSAVRAQADGNMNDYYSKTLVAKKIETLILEESTETLDNSVRQQAMLCIVALSQVNPPFHLCQKLDLVNAGIASVFSLPLIMPSLDRKESASFYLQMIQALDDMLQALVMDNRNPNMIILQNFLEIILPWLTLSDKSYEQSRALCTISHLLRFICNFPELSYMTSFSMSGKLMGILGLYCLNPDQDISMGASEALHYLFKILVLHRSMRQKTEAILRDLQKNFRGNCLASIQDLTLFFRKYLTPLERADVIIVCLEALTSSSMYDILAASKMLKKVLKHTLEEISKVSEIIQYIYYHIDKVTERTAQANLRKIFYLLAQYYTDEVILTLFKIQDQSERGMHRPWEILAAFPKGYRAIVECLLKRLNLQQDQDPCGEKKISPLIATRTIQELLLVQSQRLEMQTFFGQLFITLLFRVSFLVVEGSPETQDQLHGVERVDLVSSTVDTMKTLLRSSGYMDHMLYVQTLGGWELLVNPQTHYDGVSLLARSLVDKNCWHNRPVFSLLIKNLQDPECTSHFTALVFLTEMLKCPDVANIMNDVTANILANWFKCEEPATVKQLLKMTEVFTQHINLVRRLHILQPYVLSGCYSSRSDLVMETFLTLQRILKDLTWKHSSSFIIQLPFTLEPFLEEESEQLRLTAFQIYEKLLAKITRRMLVFPLRHQILNLVVLFVLHLMDANDYVEEACRFILCSTAFLLGWSRLRAVFANSDVVAILWALLRQERSKALWFLKQSLSLFKSPQAPIRQAAVWFTGQIIQSLDLVEREEIEEAYTALRRLQRDPDPSVSCLTIQTFYILEAKEKVLLAKTPSSWSCFCVRRRQRRHF